MQRLILGPGKHWEKKEGDIFLDILPFPNVDIVHDLNVTPWPFSPDTFVHISAVHVVEHLDNLVKFMDQCWDLLQKGGSLYIETPEAGGDPDLTHADPTHVRCYRRHTFINYFTREGIDNFGYTNKPWSMLELKIVNNCIIFHGEPLK